MGNAISMRKVGEVYQYGKGVVIDKDKAKLWYRKASKAGDSIATVRLNEPFEILNLGIKPRKFLFDKHLKN
ncbi:SEL1-like repeat protein [Dyadobacter sp. NIV53]|uniref:SEL1-like repeat protein n=1 Tax=Dyadobacter sp. NIV53 TaxID=2861765 RepID=UPI001C8724A1|nr:SEL1-like repeat protein [Dyadobacter sp. NIV53]